MLYEVITRYEINSLDNLYYPTKGIDLSVNFSHSLYSRSVMNEPIHGKDFTYFVNEREGRITSYNVCYTKLLRDTK